MKYIKIYDDVVSKEFCDGLISKFQENKAEWIKRDTNLFKFDEINLVKSRHVFESEMTYLYETFQQYIDYYIKDCGIQSYQFPKEYGFEEMRMKHYEAGIGEFKPHVDSIDGSSKRFLVFFLYLDEGQGGETVFIDQNTYSERKPGRLLMFPPTWTYPHAGMKPTENDKYIIGSYLHYV